MLLEPVHQKAGRGKRTGAASRFPGKNKTPLYAFSTEAKKKFREGPGVDKKSWAERGEMLA